MSNLAESFAEMKSRFNADAADGVDAVFQYEIDDNRWYVTVADGACDVTEGTHDDPSLTLTLAEQVFLEVMSGETDGMQAFMMGQIQADGNMMLAPQIAELFPVPA